MYGGLIGDRPREKVRTVSRTPRRTLLLDLPLRWLARVRSFIRGLPFDPNFRIHVHPFLSVTTTAGGGRRSTTPCPHVYFTLHLVGWTRSFLRSFVDLQLLAAVAAISYASSSTFISSFHLHSRSWPNTLRAISSSRVITPVASPPPSRAKTYRGFG